MKARELRIGNFVDWNGELGVVSQLLEKDVFFKCGETDLYDALKPIPLTEKWLIKFGFEKADNVIPIYSIGKISIYFDCEMYPNGRLYFNSWCILKEKPKYVHQLQNLYFALTNEELTIINQE